MCNSSLDSIRVIMQFRRWKLHHLSLLRRQNQGLIPNVIRWLPQGSQMFVLFWVVLFGLLRWRMIMLMLKLMRTLLKHLKNQAHYRSIIPAMVCQNRSHKKTETIFIVNDIIQQDLDVCFYSNLNANRSEYYIFEIQIFILHHHQITIRPTLYKFNNQTYCCRMILLSRVQS